MEIELGAEPVAVALRIRPVQQRDAVQDVAVQHGDRSAVLHLLHGVEQERGRDAVEREVHAPERAPADRELASEVVAGGDARQDLDGAHRVVGQQVAQVLDFRAPQRLLRRHRLLLLAESLAGDLHRLGIGPGAVAEDDGHVERRRVRPRSAVSRG